MLTYARHVQAGRVPHRLVSEDNIGLPQRAPDPAKVLAGVAEAADAGKALDNSARRTKPIRSSRPLLAELRGKTAGRRTRRDRGGSGAHL